MASGCTASGSTTSSVLFQKLTPDTLVQYTGVPFPQFGICTGDLLSEVDAAILAQIVNFAAGKGITLTDIDLTSCDCFKAKVGCCGKTSCQTLECILQAYLECLCELYTDVQTLKTTVSSMFDGPYDTKCLTSVTSASKLPAILQEVVTELCTTEANLATLTATVSALASGIDTKIGNFLSTAIRSCQTDAVKKAGTGASFNVTFAGFCPIGTIVMYGGPVSGVFDTTGLGISPGPACGWALCNGAVQNGITTVDMRGYFPVGVNNGSMGGGSQNAEVDNGVHPGQSYGLNAHGGEIRHTLTSAEIPAVPFAGSSLTTTVIGKVDANDSRFKFGPDDHALVYPPQGSLRIPGTEATVTLTIPPISVSGSTQGGGGAHENRAPYRALYFIQRVA